VRLDHRNHIPEEMFMSFFLMPDPISARRLFLGRSTLMLSGAAVALLSGNEALAATAGAADPRDVQILNTALGAELEAIAAYQLGAESKLLQKPVLDLAVTFQGHHKAHADLLMKTVEKLGGKPVAAKSNYNFPADKLKSQADVLRFAASLEHGAVAAPLKMVPGSSMTYDGVADPAERSDLIAYLKKVGDTPACKASSVPR
jgi:Ferritin-like domain